MDAVRVELRCEGRRSIVGDRQAIDHILDLILRAPWVQDAVGLEQPSRFGVHHVG